MVLLLFYPNNDVSCLMIIFGVGYANFNYIRKDKYIGLYPFFEYFTLYQVVLLSNY